MSIQGLTCDTSVVTLMKRVNWGKTISIQKEFALQYAMFCSSFILPIISASVKGNQTPKENKDIILHELCALHGIAVVSDFD